MKREVVKYWGIAFLLMVGFGKSFSIESDMGQVSIKKTDSISGCTDPLAANYNPFATIDDGSCIYYDSMEIDSLYGCTDYVAINYNPFASLDDGSCIYDSVVVDRAVNISNQLLVLENVNIYPLPTTGEFYVSFYVNIPSKLKLDVYNQLGKLVLRHDQDFTNGLYRIGADISELPNGLYFIQLGNSKELRITKKIIKH